MADDFIPPRIRVMLVCDSFEKLEEDVFNLYGVRHYLGAEWFPFAPSDLCLFVLVSSAHKGEYSGLISIVDEQTNKMIYMVELNLEFEEDGQFLSACYRIACRFPQPGRYRIVLSFLQPPLEKEDIVKAEMPFWVFNEGE